ncbi:GNAT family N-acetyltransferase [Flavobacterium marginilacus]|uniref:GNAT family N-acetyltransferase n=1 Tax=Flavobacterium marginilacus TaxID=3003256 RepID=UPI00248EAE35|nr:GNAT family N-acetyltransferase [Flavobacterium marginilacus]
MITISEAVNSDIKTIQDIVYKTWPITYGEILSAEQLQYMLDLFYSDEALTAQFDEKQQLFHLITEEETVLGFIGIEHHYQKENKTKIHKIYILPETQGRGIGRIAVEAVEKLALENNSDSLLLNVNRFNKALNFYQKIGFEVFEEVNIEIGNGYLMEDFVMIKKL